jgi:cobalt/nickel transport system permease protein
MAIIMTFVGLGTYRLIAGRSELTARRRTIAAAIGGYVGINASALATAIELGLQPVFFHSANGTPLYSPYHLGQTIPAMALAHLTVAGGAEAIVTGSVFAYLAQANPELLLANHPGLDAEGQTIRPAVGSRFTPGWFTPGRMALAAISLMVLITPLGLLAPGGAFGEEAPGQLNLDRLGLTTVPSGLNRWNGFWTHTLLNGYGFAGGSHQTLGYLLSAVIGIAVVGASVFGVGTLIKRLTRTASE